MARTVVVYDHAADTPAEVGRAWLNPDGSVTVRGFDAETREQYMSEGIPDFSDPGDGDAPMVPATDGERFLDVLLMEYSGSRIRAQEEAALPGRPQ